MENAFSGGLYDVFIYYQHCFERKGMEELYSGNQMKNRKTQRKVLGVPSNFGSDCNCSVCLNAMSGREVHRKFDISILKFLSELQRWRSCFAIQFFFVPCKIFDCPMIAKSCCHNMISYPFPTTYSFSYGHVSFIACEWLPSLHNPQNHGMLFGALMDEKKFQQAEEVYFRR